MPFHSSADIETIFDTDFGDGYLAVVSPVSGSDYSVNVLRDKNVDKIDSFGNIHEKVTLLHFMNSSLPAQLARGTEVTLDGTTYIIETLSKQDTYTSTYEVS